MHILVQGMIEAIDQGTEILESLNLNHYKEPAKPILDYSIGSHFRHILDLIHALKEGIDKGSADYNNRRRGHIVERDPGEAAKELIELKKWILNLEESNLFTEITVISEALLSNNKSVKLQSTIARELLFVSSHAIHHYAIITTAMKQKGINVNNKIGYAPATVSYLRSNS